MGDFEFHALTVEYILFISTEEIILLQCEIDRGQSTETIERKRQRFSDIIRLLALFSNLFYHIFY